MSVASFAAAVKGSDPCCHVPVWWQCGNTSGQRKRWMLFQYAGKGETTVSITEQACLSLISKRYDCHGTSWTIAT